MPPEQNAKKHRPNIAIIITDFNGWAQTLRCLNALHNSSYKDFEIILVDHGTTNETRDGLLREFPEIIRVTGSNVLWWAGASNMGIRVALERNIPFIMLLNNDCFVRPDTIDILMGYADKITDAIIAPVQRNSTTGKYMAITPRDILWIGLTTWNGIHMGITQTMRKQRILPTRLIGGGRGVLIPREVFEKVGLMDEKNLPHYYADHDFYFRCRSAGIPLFVAIDAEVNIDNSRTSSANQMENLTWREFVRSLSDIRSHRNVFYLRALFKKHYPIRPFYFIGLWLATLRYLIVYLIKRLQRAVGLRGRVRS